MPCAERLTDCFAMRLVLAGVLITSGRPNSRMLANHPCYSGSLAGAYQEGTTTTPVAVPFLLTTVTFVPTFRSATVLPSGRIFVSEVTVTICDAVPLAGVRVRVVPLLALATAEIVPTR